MTSGYGRSFSPRMVRNPRRPRLPVSNVFHAYDVWSFHLRRRQQALTLPTANHGLTRKTYVCVRYVKIRIARVRVNAAAFRSEYSTAESARALFRFKLKAQWLQPIR